MIRTLGDYIEKTAISALSLQAENGAFPPGTNGPRLQPETPVRNTAHWLSVMAKAHELTGRAAFRVSAIEALHYLLSSEARPTGRQFYCLREDAKSPHNGLVGQAWAVEGLISGATFLHDAHALNVARTVLGLHPFDEDLGAWLEPDFDTCQLTYNRRFNHQLWFAAVRAASATLIGDEQLRRESEIFLQEIPKHLHVRRSGLIKHSDPRFLGGFNRETVRRIRKNAGAALRDPVGLRLKENGYHGFNTYAFGLLKGAFSDSPVWSQDRIRRSLEYLTSPEYQQQVELSPYGFGYNPPGIESAYSLHSFGLASRDDLSRLLAWQFATGYDHSRELMDKNALDPATSASRIYESVHLDSDLSINIEDV